MNIPAISVLMPVYNCVPYLDDAIWSIRRQTFSDFEFIVANDGSTDQSLTILRRHAAEDPRIILLDRANAGIVDALNAGLEKCRGKYVVRMDGDDIALVHRLETQLAWMEAHPKVAALGSASRLIDREGKAIGKIEFPESHHEIEHLLIESGWGLTHPTAILCRERLLKVGGYRNEACFAEDLDIYLRLGEVAELANLPDVLLLYRRHSFAVGERLVGPHSRAKYLAISEACRRRGLANRPVLSRHAYDASWSTGNEGRKGDAIRYAFLAWAHEPLGLTGYRALARSLATARRSWKG